MRGASDIEGSAGPGRRTETPFSDFVRSLDEDGEPRDRAAFDGAWAALKRFLVFELKRRGLWNLPPGFLGLYGGSAWSHPETLEELAVDAYVFVFGRRLQGLWAQLRVKRNIEGLVVRSLRNFLHETQRKHDPIGFRVFEVVRAAARNLVRRGELQVLRGDPRVSASSVLSRDPQEKPGSPVPDYEHIAQVWASDLLPDLVVLRGPAVLEVQGRLEEKILGLVASGFPLLSLKPMIGAVKGEVRRRWNSVGANAGGKTAWGEADGDLKEVVRLVHPSSELEERESFHRLVSCIESGIRQQHGRVETREQLLSLLVFLQHHAADGTFRAPSGEDWPAGDPIPSNRQLGSLLHIRRLNLPRLFATLRRLAEGCLEALGSAAGQPQTEGRS